MPSLLLNFEYLPQKVLWKKQEVMITYSNAQEDIHPSLNGSISILVIVGFLFYSS